MDEKDFLISGFQLVQLEKFLLVLNKKSRIQFPAYTKNW